MKELLQQVTTDDAICRAERETILRFDATDDRATMMSFGAGIMRRLLAHPEFEVEAVTVVDGDSRPDRTLDEVGGRDIVGVRGSLPIGAVSISSSTRSTNQHAAIVSRRVLDDLEGSGE